MEFRRLRISVKTQELRQIYNPHPWKAPIVSSWCEIITDRIIISTSKLSPPLHDKDVLLRTDKAWYRWPFGKAIVLVNRDDGTEARLDSSEWKNMLMPSQLPTHIRCLSTLSILDINSIQYEDEADQEAPRSKTSTNTRVREAESTDFHVSEGRTLAVANAQRKGGVDLFDSEISSSEEHDDPDESHESLWAEGVDLRLDMLENEEDLKLGRETPDHQMLLTQLTRQAESARAIIRKWAA
ncbi:hypothetical protein H2200_012991 [Cladophialophora chaetospira]|uniref:Uncharacterized protein n=1 Tax=Cladophialophora chaetospira TaxID=386627 RepID=A0AA39CBN5_9EURO|nr:hypothetical protein H2200_012991 [Cladophialophora chaetospira]